MIIVAAEDAMPLEALSDSSRERPAGSFDEFSPYPPIADYAFLSFTHLALINAVMHVIRKEQEAQRLAMGCEVPDQQP